MKKFTLILTAAMLASSAMAAAFDQSPRELAKPTSKSVNFQPELRLDQATILTADPRQGRSATEVITDPGYDPISYTTVSKGFISYYGACYPGSKIGINNIVYGRNNDVYIQDIVNSYSTGTYVAGEFDEDFNIRVNFPQTVLFADFGGGMVMEIEANVLKFTYSDTEGGVSIFYEIAEDNSVTYTVDFATGEITLNLPEWEVPADPSADNLFEYGIALTCPYEYEDENGEIVKDFYWMGYADTNQTKTYFGKYPVYAPEGLETEAWAMVSPNNYTYVDVAIDEDKSEMYIMGLNEFDPASAIVGTIADGQVCFKSPQYMGWCSLYGVPVYFATGEFDENISNFVDDTFNTALVFDYDAAKKVMTCVNPAMGMIENAAEDYSYPFRYFLNPTIKLQDIEETYASPTDPSLISCVPYEIKNGEGYIVWNIPSINVKNALIPTDLMYYNLFVDGEIFEISPDEYVFVEEEMVDIPYNYTDMYDINIGGSTHWIYYYLDGVETMGVQSFYAADNGKTYSSNLITYDLATGEVINEGGAGETSGIQAVESSQVAASYYTNLMGQRIANPGAGIYIKTVIMIDGSVKSFKVMK